MRRVEPYMPEGMGVWFLRYEGTEDEKVADRGPYLARKSALKGARQMNEEVDFVGEDYLTGEPEGPSSPEVRDQPERTPRVKPAKPKAPKIVTVEDTPALADEPKVVATSAERHQWVEDAAQFALDIVSRAGGIPTAQVRVTLGWPLMGRKYAGECWHEEASSDGSREIFIAPSTSSGRDIVSTLVHELCHACLPKEAKHGPSFRKLGEKAGLVGKPTHMDAGPELFELIDAWIKVRGDYPAGQLDKNVGRKKQSTRLIKAECGECGYTIRTTRKWLAVGHPHCPDVNCAGHDEPMQVDGGEEEEGGDEE